VLIRGERLILLLPCPPLQLRN